MWSSLLLILTALFCCLVVYRRSEDIDHIEYLAYLFFTALSITAGFEWMEQASVERAADILFLFCMALLMVILLVSIWFMQPDYARYPVIYSYVPLLIVPFYSYFIDSALLTDIIIVAIQFTSLVVYTGLIYLYVQKVENGILLVLSVAIFFISLILYWILDIEYARSITHFVIAIGMILTSFKFPSVITQNKRS
ncbi:MAG: hypothetical protein GVY08_12425 [Bacteroidetes bacterium]|nr:hypothetical protein [Bacteroidota bacterium]